MNPTFRFDAASRPASRRGFSLIEVLVSIGILSVGVMAMASFQIIGLRGNVDSEDRTKASAIVQSRLNEFVSLPYVQNVQTGSIEQDCRICATKTSSSAVTTCVSGGAQVPCATSGAGWSAPVDVNEAGLTAPEMEARFGVSGSTSMQFRYQLSWMIEDVGDQTQPGGFKRLSMRVTWTDRSVQATGEQGKVEVSDIPISPIYQ